MYTQAHTHAEPKCALLSGLADDVMRIGFLRFSSLLSPAGRRLGRNAAWLLLDRLIRILLGLSVGAWVARHLGPEAFGRLSFSVAIVAMLQAVANLGADPIIVRDLARSEREAGEILGTAFAFRLITGVIAWIAGSLVAYALSGGDENAALLTAIVGGALVFQAADTIDLWFQSRGENRRSVIPKVIGYVTSNLFKVVLIVRDAPIEAFALALTIDAVLGAIGLAIALRRFPTKAPWIATIQRGRLLALEASPFLVGNIAILLYMRIDQVLLKHYSGNAALGMYSAALTLSTFPGFIPVLLNTVFAPRFAELKIASEHAYQRELRMLFQLYAGLGILFSVGISAFSGIAISALFGSNYAPAAALLAIHSVTNVFIFLGVAQFLWIVNEGKGLTAIYKSLAGLIVCVVSNVLLIPRLGARGAAISAVIVQFIASVGINALIAPQIFSLQIAALSPAAWIRSRRMG